MHPAGEYLKNRIEEMAEEESWELIESALEEGEAEGGEIWFAVYRLPVFSEAEAAPEGLSIEERRLEEGVMEGPPLIFEVESNYVTVQSPISLRMDFVKARIQEVFEIIGRYGFGLEIDRENFGSEVDLFLTYRIYASGFNMDVVRSVLDALAPCAYELLDLEERFSSQT